jgi:mannose-6-phosphate isomerase-like protein (cupin superfamily)
MDAFLVDEQFARLAPRRDDFAHFFTASRLSLTVVRWLAGTVDDQTPHAEDEVYHVVRGSGRITVAGETAPVGPGSIVYVAAGVEHRFHDIAADLEVLVLWAPPRRVPADRQPPPTSTTTNDA